MWNPGIRIGGIGVNENGKEEPRANYEPLHRRPLSGGFSLSCMDGSLHRGVAYCGTTGHSLPRTVARGDRADTGTPSSSAAPAGWALLVEREQVRSLRFQEGHR